MNTALKMVKDCLNLWLEDKPFTPEVYMSDGWMFYKFEHPEEGYQEIDLGVSDDECNMECSAEELDSLIKSAKADIKYYSSELIWRE